MSHSWGEDADVATLDLDRLVKARRERAAARREAAGHRLFWTLLVIGGLVALTVALVGMRWADQHQCDRATAEGSPRAAELCTGLNPIDRKEAP